MNLIELIEKIKTMDSAQALIAKELPNTDFDLVDIYLIDDLSIRSTVQLFDAEKIPNTLVMNSDGITYVNLFPLYLAQEMTQECISIANRELSNEDIAKRLLEYRINDA